MKKKEGKRDRGISTVPHLEAGKGGGERGGRGKKKGFES